MKKQKGFTLINLVAIFVVLFWLACVGGIIWVIAHFVAKFW